MPTPSISPASIADDAKMTSCPILQTWVKQALSNTIYEYTVPWSPPAVGMVTSSR